MVHSDLCQIAILFLSSLHSSSQRMHWSIFSQYFPPHDAYLFPCLVRLPYFAVKLVPECRLQLLSLAKLRVSLFFLLLSQLDE